MPGKPRKLTFRRKAADPVTFKHSNEVQHVAEELIALYGQTFGHLRRFKLAHVLVGNRKAPADRRLDALVRAFKAPPMWRELSGYHGGIAVLEAAWQPLDERQRKALVYHALAHLGINEKDEIRVERHDVEAFLGEARYYGETSIAIVRLAEQLDLFDRSADNPGGPTADEPRPTRKPIDLTDQPPAQA